MSTKPINRKSIQDRLEASTPGAVATEEGGVGKAGLYRHPESGEEAHTLSDPLFGEAQSNAFEQLGFVRVRDSRPEEVKTVVDFSLAANAGQTDSLKGLSARLDQLEGVAERNKELEAQVAKLQKEATDRLDSTTEAGHDAKVAAANQVKLRDQAPDADPRKQVGKAPSTPPAAPLNSDADKDDEGDRTHVRDDAPGGSDEGDEGDEPEDEKPVQKQNETELKATAEAEGVDLSGAETVKAKREAILAAREGNKESEQE